MNTTLNTLRKIKALRFAVWGCDISHPGDCKEYQEHHKDIQYILFMIDEIIEYLEAEIEEGIWNTPTE